MTQQGIDLGLSSAEFREQLHGVARAALLQDHARIAVLSSVE
jgi:hypothetical protein